MSPDEIEDRIQALNADIEQWQFMRDTHARLSEELRILQRRRAAEIAQLVAMRSPATVARMERERGLA